jgi:signal transduction histidine kinase
MEFNEVQIVILTSSAVLFTILILSVILFTVFQKKKTDFILREKEQEKRFEKTLTESQIEIRENALKNIAWELHDNVGQLLSIARLELNILQPIVKGGNIQKVKEISELIRDSLQDIRSLSKTLNPDVINNMGLIQAIENDISRFNRLKFIDAKLNVSGNRYAIPKKDVVILFRILQEFFNNTIKHSKATTLKVDVEYKTNSVHLCAKDNGKGYDETKIKKGSGLINMKSRANLINTKIKLSSNSNGTEIKLIYKNKTQDET